MKTYDIIEITNNGSRRTTIKSGFSSLSAAWNYIDPILSEIVNKSRSSAYPSPVECRGGILDIDYEVIEVERYSP